MNQAAPEPARLLLLGVDHARYSQLTVAAQHDQRTAAAISVGGQHVWMRKGDLAVPNEDAVLAIDAGERTLLAVADGHHGHWASHGLVEALADAEVPKDPLALLRLLTTLPVDPATVADPDDPDGELPPDLEDARSTLLIAVVDRSRQQGFGVSFGDSSLWVLGRGGPPARQNRKDTRYVTPWVSGALDPRLAQEFGFAVAPGDLVLVASDGIDECHYGRPETSIGPEHLWNLLLDTGGGVEQFARALGELALQGVEGNPGGQDNLALVLTRV